MPLNDLYRLATRGSSFDPTTSAGVGAGVGVANGSATAGASFDPLQITAPPLSGVASSFEPTAIDLALDVELSRDIDLGSDFDW